ncbi:hypothetical protein [Bacillus phage phiAGATE]|uniref:SsDNA binding domain protein n=1 Tax=Bacillus phage phiAGATE TaxID=1204533 RepID=L0L8I5_9CAUD|nr:single strand DNA binding protein [Bacillus phage phiAGATE]AGB62739.1 hypothetical protein [Bacillus phage phiAGATE]
MNFQDILKNEIKKAEQSGGSNFEGVKYPQTKHKKLFHEKNNPDVYVQVLPSAALAGADYAIPSRKIFLSAVSSQGKEIKSNFVLHPEPNPYGILEQKVTDWQARQMIPSGYGGQQKVKQVFLANVIKIVAVQGQDGQQHWVQERDENGQLVIRVMELPKSAREDLNKQLVDPMLNTSGTNLSFIDPNRAAVLKISKPPQGSYNYSVTVYTNLVLPPLDQGWEGMLEPLEPHAVATEELPNGKDWVNAFIDMKEGRKPNGGNEQQAPAAPPAGNPYGQQMPPAPPQGNPYGQQMPAQPYAPQAPQAPAQGNPYEQPASTYVPPAPTPPVAPAAPAQPDAPVGNPYEQQQPAAAPSAPPQAPPAQPAVAPAQPAPPAQPAQPQQTPPSQPDLTNQSVMNGNDLPDMDKLLEEELKDFE